MEIEFPHKLLPLFQPKRNKVVYGGRGGLKTWQFARALLLRGARQFERVVCCRETMDSIEESVHHTLEQQISELGLDGQYTVQQRRIIGRWWCTHCGARRPADLVAACECGKESWRQTEFIFAGLRYNVANIKSLEGATIVWVEEAESVSKHSWDTLLPTIRWEDKSAGRQSEVWVSFNPRLATDETYKRWILNPPPDTWVCRTTYRDNPWFPEVLRVQMEHARLTDPETYQHVWEGECARGLAGAIYAKEYKAAVAAGRIMDLPCDPSKPVDTFWDLGFGDRNCIWFVQRLGPWWHFIDYIEGVGETLSYYVIEMQRKGYVLGTCYLPHDGVDAMLHGKLSNDRSKSPDMALRALGMTVRIAPKLEIETGINAVRTVFPMCRFDRTKCAEGLSALEHYQWGPPSANGQERTKPLHDWASHGADALRTFGVTAKPEAEKQQAKAEPRRTAPRNLSPWS
jgi:phage terminase large subunit